jgi:hypothetical protein
VSHDLQLSKSERRFSTPAQNLKSEREDWTSFRTVEGLQQKAGVPDTKLRRLVLKELIDNAHPPNAPYAAPAWRGMASKQGSVG